MSASSIISAKGGRLLVISPSTCFTNAAATINAVVGDAVTSVSGGGMYLQAPTGTKPYLRQASGVYYLEFGLDAELVHTTVGVTYNSDHARGIVMSTSSTGYPHFWRTYNPAHGIDRSAVSTLTYFAGQPIVYWGNYNGSEVHDIWNGSTIGSGITGITTCRRGTLSTLRVNGAQTNSATFTPTATYYPDRSCLAASSSEGFNVYAVWDVPTTLSDAEALEIENDLGTQAGASWASSGATSAVAATTANAVGSLTSKSSPLSSIAATTASLTAAWTSSTGAASSAITATTANTVGALTSTGSTSNGTFTSEVLRDNTGTVVASKALNHVALYNDTTGALVVRKTGLSTNGSGVFTFTDAALTAGTTYRVDWEDVDGRRRMPRKAAT